MRHKAYQHFYQAYTYLVETLAMIGYRGHIEKHGDLYSDWGTVNRSEAQQIIASITSFDFIVVLMVVYQYLSHMPGISTQLQSTTLDIIEAHSMVGRLLIMYMLFIILPLIYTEVFQSFWRVPIFVKHMLVIMSQREQFIKKINSKIYINNNFNFYL